MIRHVVSAFLIAVFLAVLVVDDPRPTRLLPVTLIFLALGVTVWWWQNRRQQDTWAPVYDLAGREQRAYVFGAVDIRTRQVTHLKFGWSGQEEGAREGQVAGQVLRTHEIVRLADGPGGEAREQKLHRRLMLSGVYRYPRSEWFAVEPASVAALGEFERITPAGWQVIRDHGNRRRWRA